MQSLSFDRTREPRTLGHHTLLATAWKSGMTAVVHVIMYFFIIILLNRCLADERNCAKTNRLRAIKRVELRVGCTAKDLEKAEECPDVGTCKCEAWQQLWLPGSATESSCGWSSDKGLVASGCMWSTQCKTSNVISSSPRKFHCSRQLWIKWRHFDTFRTIYESTTIPRLHSPATVTFADPHRPMSN